jgi:hypothetical protein
MENLMCARRAADKKGARWKLKFAQIGLIKQKYNRLGSTLVHSSKLANWGGP